MVRLFLLLFLFFASLRLAYPLIFKFPLNDGGLFYTMSTDLLSNHFVLPAFTSYNLDHIPFAYPPLAFYLTASLSALLHFPIIQLIRFLPPIFSVLSIPLFFLFCLRLTHQKNIAFFSTIVYCSLPYSHLWTIMGGGLTRSLGLVTSLISLLIFLTFLYRRRLYLLPILSIFIALTFLSHLEWALFLTYSLLTLSLFYPLRWSNLKSLIFSFLFTGILISPWLATVIFHHGLAPFFAASLTNPHQPGSYLLLLKYFFFHELGISLFSLLSLFGAFFLLKRRQYLLPIWLVTIIIINTRSAPAISALISSLLIGDIFSNIFWPAISGSRNQLSPKIAISIILVLYNLSVFASLIIPSSPFKPLSLANRTAMNWIKTSTPLTSRFLVLTSTPADYWGQDEVSEWFPALSARQSLTVIQGYEWVSQPGNTIQDRSSFNLTLNRCPPSGSSCLDQIIQSHHLQYDYLYVTSPLWITSLHSSPSFKLVYQRPQVDIFRHLISP